MATYKTYVEKGELRRRAVESDRDIVVWAYAFAENNQKEGMRLNQKPIKGIISCVRSHVFIPFKKNSETEYAISKEISIDSRCYADTEEEAIQEYNQLIQDQIEWYHAKISKLEGMKIEQGERQEPEI